jgi:hypothetical protein
VDFEAPGFGNQRFEFGEEFFFSGFDWHGAQCAPKNWQRQCLEKLKF